jgi:organic radical activating enzyme
MTDTNNFYCSQKFWWALLHFEKLEISSCCSARPQKININWLKENPGKIFNTPELIDERKLMLSGQPVPSCAENCWVPEKKGLISRRIKMASHHPTHLTTESNVEFLNLNIGNTCNLSCVYCCKQYSSAWANDLKHNGKYQLYGFEDRYSLDKKDQVLLELSQKDHKNSKNTQQLIKEIKSLNFDVLKKILISGGEPFLFLYLIDLLNVLPSHIPTEIITGLGVGEKRFIRLLTAIKSFPNVSLTISAESTGKNYEFVRTGNTWDRFQKNLTEIKNSGIGYRFNSVMNNLALLDIENFSFYKIEKLTYSICNEPSFLHPCVLDSTSKARILGYLATADHLPTEMVSNIVQSIKPSPTDLDRQNLKIYLLEFSKRRGLSLDIFPESFISWVNDVV